MPRKPVDYSKTHFYKIVCKNTDITDCYVGHTTDFTRRKSYHNVVCNDKNNKNHNTYVYQFIRENGGWDNWDVISIKVVGCENNLEARKIERECIEELKPTLNQNKPFVEAQETKERVKQWHKDNLEYRQEMDREYRVKHKSHIKDIKKQYYENNKQLWKQYYVDNKQKIGERGQQRFKCECGGRFTHNHRPAHLKTKKHIDFMHSNSENI